MASANVLALISILTSLGGLFLGLFKVLKKMIEFIDSVDSVVSRVNKLYVDSENMHKSIIERLNDHDKHFVKHDEQLNALIDWKKEKWERK